MNRVRRSVLLTVLVLGAQRAIPQQPVPPPPKPADSGPSLAVTMQFIQDKLKEKGGNRSSLGQFDDISADPAICQLTLDRTGKWGDVDWDEERVTVSFREVERIEVTDAKLNVLTTTEKSVHVRHFKKGKPRPKSDRDRGDIAFSFADDYVDRVAKAMLHAVELCGGGSKQEPF